MTGGGRRGRVGGKSRQVEGSGTVCAAHMHKIATPNTGSMADRGWVVSGQADSSGQTESSDEGGRRGDVGIYIQIP